MTQDMMDAARRALLCLDLTDLSDDCTEEDVDRLCARAVTPHGSVAAICIWPRFVAHARQILAPDVRIATVVNFPSGAETAEDVIAMTEQAVFDGADEIDVVVRYRDLMEGRPQAVTASVERTRRAAGPEKKVKAILETGVLGSPEMIRRAADLALEGGADFIKTSTGKVPVNATLAAGEVMLTAILEADADAGLKPAGGIRTTEDAAAWLALCDKMMGPGWATPTRFRIGASGVLDALLATLDGTEARAASGY